MLIGINNKELEFKLSTISRKSGVKKDAMMQQIMEAFVDRYEERKGKITPPAMHKKTSSVFIMYNLYKKHYFEYFKNEYKTDLKLEKRDMRSMKLLKEKIMKLVMDGSGSEVVVIDEQDIFNAFEAFLTKMPEWWVTNHFTPASLYKNFEKIIEQIKNNGKQRKSGKDALDNFIKGLGG